MSFPTQQLQPFTLYITVSVPEEPPEILAPRYDYDSSIIEICEEESSDGDGKFVLGSTDFDWGIYWHRELGDGTWYTYDFTHPAMYKGPPGLYKRWTYNRADVKQSPRLHHHVVGLIRFMRVSDEIGERITDFLDWLAPLVASNAERDDAWAMTICLQTRMYVAHERKMVDNGEDFDTIALVYQTLHLAYPE
ncbi:hypothetical protein ACLX1H_001323 [Fusarium chlamydosporum]